MAPRRLSLIWTSWIEEWLEDNSLGDDITWDVSMGMAPDGFAAQIVFFMPSPLLGQHLMVLATVGNPVAPDRDEVLGMVHEAVEHLRVLRTQAVSSEVVLGNGHPPHEHEHEH